VSLNSFSSIFSALILTHNFFHLTMTFFSLRTLSRFSTLLLLFLFIQTDFNNSAFAQDSKWVGTWAAAPYEAGTNTPPSPFLANNTLRQIVRVSIGGDSLRVKFSNRTGSSPVTFNSVNIAVSVDSSTSVIDSSTITQLTFSGSNSVTMDAYTEVTSDPVAFDLTPGSHLAITIYYGEIETAPDMTFHYGSRTDSYILEGDHTLAVEFTGGTVVERWYTLSSIDVLAPTKSAAVGVIGNSITDGYGIHDGRHQWPDTFSERLLADSATSHVGVLNLGIGATLVSTSGVSRFEQDVLAQSGLRWAVVFYGVNDIGGGASAETVINAYRSLIAQSHAHNIRIYGATITPFNGHGFYSTTREEVRQEVNEWIRTPGNFDAVIDFDKALRDPNDPSRMQAQYSNDWLHPSIEGYNFLGESVDPDLFLGADTVFAQPAYTTDFYEPECATVGENWNIVDDETASNGKYITVHPGTQSLNSPPADSTGLIYLPFSVDTTSSFTVYGRMRNSTFDDDSFWIKVDDGEFELYNGLVTSGWQWVSLGTYNLDEGDHQITIGYREDGANLDKIAVSNSVIPPSGEGGEAVNSCTGTSNEPIPDSPRGYRLQQNYPNPFNPSTVINYELAENSSVQLSVFDMTGRKISQLVNQKQSAGQHSVTFEANGLSSGIYFYQLKTASGTTLSRKMILMK
jgi:lysophospholipase L1-like esterase